VCLFPYGAWTPGEFDNFWEILEFNMTKNLETLLISCKINRDFRKIFLGNNYQINDINNISNYFSKISSYFTRNQKGFKIFCYIVIE